MRFYHPDRNPALSAAQKVREINAAYAVLGDPRRRARYDAQMSMVRPDPTEPYVHGFKGVYLASWFGVAVFVAMLMLFSPLLIPQMVPGRSSAAGEAASARVDAAAGKLTLASEAQTPDFGTQASIAPPESRRPRPKTTPLNRRSGPSAIEGLKISAGAGAEAGRLFARTIVRRAVATPSPPPAPTELVVTDVPPTEPRSFGNALVAGREKIVIDNRHKEREYPKLSLAASETRATPLAPARIARESRPKAAAKPVNPSFSCGAARTWAAVSVCKSAKFASLDRQLAKLWGDAIAQAGSAERARLIDSDRKFLSGRDACASEECVDAAYSAQISQVRRISEQQR